MSNTPFPPRVVGEQIAQKYTIVETLGQGGFGVTYKANDPEGMPKVLKECFRKGLVYRKAHLVLPLPGKESLWEQERNYFKAEYTRAYQIDDPHVVRVEDLVEDGGTYFLVMRYYEGETLANYLHQQPSRHLPEAEALELMKGVLEGLQAIHAKGILHRDLKPENILLIQGKNGKREPVILDFGAATTLGQPARPDGSPATAPYAPIEQEGRLDAHGKRSFPFSEGFYTDVYAAGITLYQMLTGQNPYEASKRDEFNFPLNWQTGETPVSENVQNFVNRAAAIDPNQRFKQVHDMDAALNSLLQATAQQNLNPAPTLIVPKKPKHVQAQKPWHPWLKKGLGFVVLMAFVAFPLRMALTYVLDYQSLVAQGDQALNACYHQGDRNAITRAQAAYQKAQTYIGFQRQISALPLPYLAGLLKTNETDLAIYEAKAQQGEAKVWYDIISPKSNEDQSCSLNNPNKAEEMYKKALETIQNTDLSTATIGEDLKRNYAALSIRVMKAPLKMEQFYKELIADGKATETEELNLGKLYWYWHFMDTGMLSEDDEAWATYVAPLRTDLAALKRVQRAVKSGELGDTAYQYLGRYTHKVNAGQIAKPDWQAVCSFIALEAFHKNNTTQARQRCHQAQLSCGVCEAL